MTIGELAMAIVEAPVTPEWMVRLQWEVVWVTPDLAKEWLDVNTHNRPLSEALVRSYAVRMKRGEWEYNGQDVLFDWDGELTDGQHRLRAIIDSGTAEWLGVKWGVPPTAFETLDMGKKRSLADVLAIKGEANYVTLASTLSILNNWRTSQLNRSSPERQLTTETALQLLEATPDVRDAVEVARKLRGLHNFLSPTEVAFGYLITSRLAGEAANQFWESLESGAHLEEKSPVLMLRNKLMDAAANNVRFRIDRRHKMALVFVAWNHWRNGQKVSFIKWVPDVSPFPEPI